MNSQDKTLFSRPLILGASVSAGYGTRDNGPAAVVSRMINPQAKIMNKARSGHTSLESTRSLNYFEGDPSIVLAFDLFFWDATRNQVGKDFEENVRKLISMYRKKQIPMIIGRVPVGVKFPEAIRHVGTTQAAKRVNKLLEEICAGDSGCVLYDPRICFDRMPGPVSSEGEAFFMDSMHTTDFGNRFCAKIFVESGVWKQFLVKQPEALL